METRYIRLKYEEALSAKRELLSAELNVLTVAKRLRGYRDLRKKEFVLKNKLKSAFGFCRTKTNLILSSFPEGDKNAPRVSYKGKDNKKNGTEKNIQDELEAIKRKLEGLK